MAVYHKTPQDSNRDISRPNEIPPIAPPMPDNITGNIGNNFKVQELGKNFFQGEEMANQFAQKQMDKPVPPPGDPTGDQYGNMFSPFSQKKIVKAQLIPQRPPLEPPRVPQVPTKPTKKIYKEMVEKVPKQKMVKEMTGRQVEPRMHMPEQKMEKVREMPRPINMNGDPKKKYKMPLEGVQDLQDMGAVKKDKKGQYVVNENATSSRDTLRFPAGTKHYSGKPYKTGQLIDESDYEDIIKKVNKS